MTGRLVVLAATAAALLGTATAQAGGWATSELGSRPDGVAPGKPWDVEMTVLQHGRTPLDGVKPAVVISRGDTVKRFAAVPTGRPGVYRARVVFPTGGTWRYATDDGFGGKREFPAVQIRDAVAATPAPGPTGGDDGAPWWIALVGVGVAAALGAAAVVRRQRAPGALPG